LTATIPVWRVLRREFWAPNRRESSRVTLKKGPWSPRFALQEGRNDPEFGRSQNEGIPEYIGTRPSRKAVRRLLQRVHDATTPYKHAESPKLRVAAISRLLRGWAAYFNQGPVLPTYKVVRWYVQRRLQRWLVRRSGQAGTGYRQYSDEYLYETLGLYALPLRRADLPSAKA
jgi:hypothetical protein